MTIKHKLLFSVVVISSMLAGTLILSLVSFGGLSTGFGQVLEKAESGVRSSQSAEAATTVAKNAVSSVAARIPVVADDVHQSNVRLKIVERKIAQLSKSLTELSETVEESYEDLPEGDARDQLEEICDEIVDLQDSMRREALIGLADATKSMDASAKALTGEVGELTAAASQLESGTALSKSVKRANTEIRSLSREFGDDISWSRNLLSALLVSLSILVACVAVSFARFLTRSLMAANDIAVGIAGGDLNQEIETERNDEIGQLLASMAVMQTEMRTSMTAVQEAADADRQKTVELERVQANQLRQAEELKRAAAETQKSAEREASIAEAEARKSRELQAMVEMLLKNVDRAAVVKKLGESSAEVSEIVKVIGSIAEQTNMLALNATVEAARAGEAGRGFAVVANQVKELAHETATATESIGSKIEAIQTTSRGAVDALQGITDVVNEVNALQSSIGIAAEDQNAAELRSSPLVCR